MLDRDKEKPAKPPEPSPPPVAPVRPARPAAPQFADVDLSRENLPDFYHSVRKLDEILANPLSTECSELFDMSAIERKYFSSERAYRKYYNKYLSAKLACYDARDIDTSRLPKFLPDVTEPAKPAAPKPAAPKPAAPVAPKPAEPVDLTKENLPYNYPSIQEIEDLIADHESFECIIAFKINAIGLSDIDKSKFTSERAYRKYYNKLREAKMACAREMGYSLSGFPAALPDDDEPASAKPAAPKPTTFAEVDLKRERLPYNYPDIDEIERILANPSYWACMGMNIYTIGLNELEKSKFTSELAYRKYYNKLREARLKCAIVQGHDTSRFPAALPEKDEVESVDAEDSRYVVEPEDDDEYELPGWAIRWSNRDDKKK